MFYYDLEISLTLLITLFVDFPVFELTTTRFYCNLFAIYTLKIKAY